MGISQIIGEYNEVNRLLMLPLVFGLLPTKALARDRYDIKVKPLIKEHLSNLKITATPLLLEVLKRIADQYYYTDKETSNFQNKYTIEKLKANHQSLYKRIIDKQGERCALCGCLFDGKVIESLDHILPWRLVGDSPNGCNWQILCTACNIGKREHFTSLLTKSSYNWVYSKSLQELKEETPFAEARYVILAQRGFCEECGGIPGEVKLHVVKKISTGLAIVDNLSVVCMNCVDSRINSNKVFVEAVFAN